MTTACLCEVERPGLAAALAMRGVGVQRAGRHAVAGLRPPAGSVLVAALSAGDPALAMMRRLWPGPLMVLLRGAGQAELADALDAGADDAASDRAEDRLLAARVAALVRRTATGRPIRIGSLTIDPVARRVSRAGRAITLLPREYALLTALARQSGRVVSQPALRETVWGLRFDPGTNLVAVHVSRLRAKLDRDFTMPMLLTERGRGYRLVADSPIEPAPAAL